MEEKLKKLITAKAAAAMVKDGMTLMIGGFMTCGTPENLVDAIVESGVKNLTIIANDTGFVDKGIGKLVVSGQVKKVIASHIGTNRETGNKMNSGEIEVVLVPQGTLAEQIRSAGAGLGGVLTPIGIGTPVEEGKQKITISGTEYLVEEAMKADIALLLGSKVDKKGNIFYNKATRNFNPLMAMAADTVIVEAAEIVETGEIPAENVVTPHIFVDYIVEV